jgi:ribosome silencing factor RsfS/YbeB/iojap
VPAEKKPKKAIRKLESVPSGSAKVRRRGQVMDPLVPAAKKPKKAIRKLESVPSGSAKARRGATAKPAAGRGAPGTGAPKASLKAVILGALDDMKALELKVLDVRELTDIADYMVIASGTSDRHVRSVAQRVVEKAREAGFRPHGLEGLKDGDWVLIDLNEVIVHVMLPRVREFYGLEKLWDLTAKLTARA